MDANFALLPVSLHLQSYRVTLDPIASETTKIVFSLNLGKKISISDNNSSEPEREF